MSSPSKRRDMDVMKLMMNDYTVETKDDEINNFVVEFHGPKESLYEGGVWKVRVELPDAYPYKSPSIGFINKIYHPNVDELSGSVCLDVINQTWSPMFDLLNIFEVFLPQLLLYPNPSDPLNGDAASLMMKDKKQYDQKVKGLTHYNSRSYRLVQNEHSNFGLDTVPEYCLAIGGCHLKVWVYRSKVTVTIVTHSVTVPGYHPPVVGYPLTSGQPRSCLTFVYQSLARFQTWN
ncbi:hypothetical protein DM860_014036 [Cuscuta australis]|uniref:E2 ubiquitin-conjugating enzyme n=1 Tax=Cuscuta australis TaxID=267555 RepID=A0A328DN97_9ASTE|nr:hypothetical protein DM860_014036 [Cuscuta australis]